MAISYCDWSILRPWRERHSLVSEPTITGSAGHSFTFQNERDECPNTSGLSEIKFTKKRKKIAIKKEALIVKESKPPCHHCEEPVAVSFPAFRPRRHRKTVASFRSLVGRERLVSSSYQNHLPRCSNATREEKKGGIEHGITKNLLTLIKEPGKLSRKKNSSKEGKTGWTHNSAIHDKNGCKLRLSMKIRA